MAPNTTRLQQAFLLTTLCTALALTGCGGGGGGGGSSGQTATQSTGGSGSGSSGTTSSVSKAASISFSSATPDLLVYQGGEGETQAEVKFLVKDALNQPLTGETVTFSLNTAVGGLALQTNQAVTDSSGIATARVISGTVPTPVRVTAVAGKYSAQSSQLSISTGLPHQNGFSLSVSSYNPAFYNTDGVSITLTARASDRQGNPVPDGTTVNFVTEGGIGTITSKCSMTAGSCNVTLLSSGARNALVDAGRQTVLAYMQGEESFDDKNSNGVFDTGEFVSNYDLPEAFLDARPGQPRTTVNKAQSWLTVAGNSYSEFYLDLNRNGIHDETGNGFFDGVARSDGRAASTVHLRRTAEIIWGISNNSLIYNPTKGAAELNNFDLCPASTATVSYKPADVFANTLPAGTTVTFSVTTTALAASAALSGTTSYTVGNQIDRPETYTTNLNLATGVTCGTAATAPDTLTITIRLPGNASPQTFDFPIF
ncbi:Ig-like domain-containing protein [Vogesella sp. DC21W]|uniref:Ig-like domain-containing protein n=1 Tax=Vogesella aquatica TaxID=2984206 RepID=A0ABT5J2V6_9NEIS|nr:Ig-like domain-containing protein [Vogesella aquatica]MDC7719161.1 Ig-like domain-containing protein [Vogesella aquatica]